jgi:hypothetical protein
MVTIGRGNVTIETYQERARGPEAWFHAHLKEALEHGGHVPLPHPSRGHYAFGVPHGKIRCPEVEQQHGQRPVRVDLPGDTKGRG